MIRSSAITKHANGQPCFIQLGYGICWGGTETTVFCHMNDSAFGKGMAQKATDLAGFHGCMGCHTYVDAGHGTRPLMSDAELERAMMVAVVKTWTALVNDGVIALKVDKPKERKTKPRKPKSERTSIPSRKTEWPSRPMPSRKGLLRG